MPKWLSPLLLIVMAAYVGGLIASYALLMSVDGALQSPELRVAPFYFALGIMIFTAPGAGLVAAVHNLIRERGVLAYSTAVVFGTAVGGIVLWFPSPMLDTFLIGAFYGFVTAACWSILHRGFSTSSGILRTSSADL
jgi:hypothetical protein